MDYKETEKELRKKASDDIKSNLDTLIAETKSKLDDLIYEHEKQSFLWNNFNDIEKTGVIKAIDLGYDENYDHENLTEYRKQFEQLKNEINILTDLKAKMRLIQEN